MIALSTSFKQVNMSIFSFSYLKKTNILNQKISAKVDLPSEINIIGHRTSYFARILEISLCELKLESFNAFSKGESIEVEFKIYNVYLKVKGVVTQSKNREYFIKLKHIPEGKEDLLLDYIFDELSGKLKHY